MTRRDRRRLPPRAEPKHEHPRFYVFSQRDEESSVVGLGHTLDEARTEREDAGGGHIYDSQNGQWVD